jgi:beta-N-acetylhexosaminidase
MIDLKGKPFYLTNEDIAWVEETLSGMTQDEKLRQLFCMIIYDAQEEYLLRLARDIQPCGAMFRPFPKDDAVRISRLLQENSKIPMLLPANLERGGNGLASDGTQVGTPLQVAATDDVFFAEALGSVAGREAAAVGGNWSFAPIINIDFNWRNPITNVRTFGSDPRRVLEMGVAYVKAIQKEGVAASVKHFPGDGCDERDQHLVTSINDLSCEDWDSTYGAAYKACIDAGALTVMAGHIMQPAYSRRLRPGIRDEEIMPATLAPELLKDLLRGKLGFNGLIVSDATTMAGFCIPLGREKAVPACIAAGCDVFLFTKNMEEDIAFMRKGYEDGVITPRRLDEAVTRILALKAALKLHQRDNRPTLKNADKIVGCKEHRDLARRCAERSVTLVKDKGGILPISPETHKRIMLYPIVTGESYYGGTGEDIGAVFKERLEKEGFEVTIFTPPQGMEGRSSRTTDITENYDLLLYVSNLMTKSNQTTVRIEWAQPMGANCPNYSAVVPTVFVSLANPYHLVDVPRVPVMINTYSALPDNITALIDRLLGRAPFVGLSPVDAFCGKWDARL